MINSIKMRYITEIESICVLFLNGIIIIALSRNFEGKDSELIETIVISVLIIILLKLWQSVNKEVNKSSDISYIKSLTYQELLFKNIMIITLTDMLIYRYYRDLMPFCYTSYLLLISFLFGHNISFIITDILNFNKLVLILKDYDDVIKNKFIVTVIVYPFIFIFNLLIQTRGKSYSRCNFEIA